MSLNIKKLKPSKMSSKAKCFAEMAEIEAAEIEAAEFEAAEIEAAEFEAYMAAIEDAAIEFDSHDYIAYMKQQ